MKKFAALLALGARFARRRVRRHDAEHATATRSSSPSANGAVARYHFNEDGTFTGVAPGGSQMAGTLHRG